MKKLPGKKVVILIIVLLVFTIGLLWYLGQKKKERDSVITAQEEKEILNREARLKQIVAEALAKDGNLKVFHYSDLPRRASSSDLIIAKSNSTSTIRDYGLEIAALLKPYETERENESEVMLRLLEKGEKKDLETLKKTAVLYQETEASLLKVSVPKDAAFLHTKLVNRLRLMSALVKNMNLVLKEPVLATKSAEIYQSELALFYQTIQEISNYLKSHQINFKPEEKIKVYVNL